MARSRRGFSAAFVVVLLLVLIIVPTVMWYVVVRQTADEHRAVARSVAPQMIGLSRHVSNRLDGRFVDADGDLVADAPSDPKLLIDPPVLRISYVATTNPDVYRDAFKDLTDHLSKALGRPVEYLPVSKIEDQLLALRDGRLHIAGFNTGSVPPAVNLCGFVPVCRIAGPDRKGFHQMVVIVPTRSALKRLEDLVGHELTCTDMSSNSGYRIAVVTLYEAGYLPSSDYMLRFSGGHTESLAGIAACTYEAAAVASDMLERAVAAGKIRKDQYRIIYTSENLPNAAIGYVYNLKPELAARLRDALLKFDWKGTSLEKHFAPSGEICFVAVSYKDDWALVRRIDNAIGFGYALPRPTTAPATEPAAPAPSTNP